jgi:hypothetical protein
VSHLLVTVAPSTGGYLSIVPLRLSGKACLRDAAALFALLDIGARLSLHMDESTNIWSAIVAPDLRDLARALLVAEEANRGWP